MSTRRLARLVVLAALLALPAGCGSNSTQPPLATDQIPLAVGNIWHFTGGYADSIESKRTVGGVDYFEMQGTALGDGFVRMDDRGRFYVKDALGTPEGLLFDFNAVVGESWTFDTGVTARPPSVTLISNDDTVTVPAGTFTGCYTFFYNDTETVTNDINFTVAPGVGIVRELLHSSGTIIALQEFVPAAS